MARASVTERLIAGMTNNRFNRISKALDEMAGVCVDSALVMKGLEERIADLEELFSHE